jgi:hypothetical protein
MNSGVGLSVTMPLVPAEKLAARGIPLLNSASVDTLIVHTSLCRHEVILLSQAASSSVYPWRSSGDKLLG